MKAKSIGAARREAFDDLKSRTTYGSWDIVPQKSFYELWDKVRSQWRTAIMHHQLAWLGNVARRIATSPLVFSQLWVLQKRERREEALSVFGFANGALLNNDGIIDGVSAWISPAQAER